MWNAVMQHYFKKTKSMPYICCDHLTHTHNFLIQEKADDEMFESLINVPGSNLCHSGTLLTK